MTISQLLPAPRALVTGRARTTSPASAAVTDARSRARLRRLTGASTAPAGSAAARVALVRVGDLGGITDVPRFAVRTPLSGHTLAA